MKTLLIILLALFFSINGISQPSSVTHELSVIDQPYEWACGEDYLDWDACYGNSGHECPTMGSYYIDVLTVLPGNKLTSFEIDVSEFNCLEEKHELDSSGNVVDTFYWVRSTFHTYVWNFPAPLDDPPNDLGWISGIDIVDLSNNESVLYVRRDNVVNSFQGGLISIEGLNILSGLYEVRIVHNEGDNLGAHTCVGNGAWIYEEIEGVGNFKFRNMEGILASPLAEFQEIGQFYEGPEIIATAITYNFEFTDFEWDAAQFHQCDSSAFIIEAPCNEELSYLWEKQIGQWWLPADGGENCQLIIPDNTLSSANSPHNYRVTSFAPNGDTLMSQTIEVLIHENPYWSYTHTGIETEGLEGACPLFFEVLIEADAGQLQNTAYTWQPDENYAELTLFSEGGGDDLEGPAIYFCFNPFNANDTIGAFYVEATNNYGIAGFEGCTTLDTTYVVYTGDSIVFKSNIFDTNLVSIQEPIPGEFKVFPNPSHGIFHLTISNMTGLAELNVLDVTGRLVLSETISANGHNVNTTIDMTGEIPGLYFIRLSDENGQVVARLVRM